MNDQKQNSNLSKHSDEFGENSASSSLTNSISISFNNSDTSRSVSEHNGLNQNPSDPVKYLYLQRLRDDQKCSVMASKKNDYEKAMAEKYTVKSMHTHMMNFQDNNYVLTNQCMNIMEKTKPLSCTPGTCLQQNTSCINICHHLNKLGDTVDDARTIQKDVMNLLDQTTKIFQEKFLNIDESLKQVSIEKMRAQQELETLESKYSLDMTVYKSDLEECTKENVNLKIENYWLLEKLNETNIRLNEEKEMILSFNQNYEKVFKEMKDQNVLLTSQNESLNIKYEDIFHENQYLKNEIGIIKNSLVENKKQLDMQSTVIKEQTELLDNIKMVEELNDALKKDNFSLKEHNEYLGKKYASLMEDCSKFKLSHKEIQNDKEKEFKDICKKYDDLLKIQKEQNEKMCKIQAEETNLKQVVDVYNNTILNLQEELKNHHILIPELQNKIIYLSTNLTNANQKLQDCNQENVTNISKFNKEKIELENQSKEYFKQIKKLTTDLVKIKSKAKQSYAEVMRLRFQCLQTNQKNPQKLTVETIEILSDEDVIMKDDDDCSIVEFNEKDIIDTNLCNQSTSKKINPKYNHSSFKRNSSTLKQISNSKMKKHKTSVDNISSRNSTISTKGLKQKIDVYQIENSLTSSFRSINLKHEDTNINEIKVDKRFNQDFHTEELKTLKEKYDVNSESKNQVLKKIFKKSVNKPSQVKIKFKRCW